MVLRIKVTKWDKHNPRSDVKSATWFRFTNDFFSDPDFYSTDLEVRVVFIYILCAASKAMKAGECKINLEMAEDQVGLPQKSIKKAISVLCEMNSIEIIGDNVISTRSDSISNNFDLYATDRQTDIHTRERTDESKPIKSSWEDWVKSYQGETGNQDGLTQVNKKLIEARIKQGFTLEDCLLVVRSKRDQWGADPKMISYLRPQTLFSGKFETYLDEAKNRHTTSSDAKVMALVNDLFPGVNLEA
jgi:uncharacterized phage protein (TIGR02220 family)